MQAQWRCLCKAGHIFSAIALKKWRFLSPKKPDYWRRHLPQIGMFTMACVSREKKGAARINFKQSLLVVLLLTFWLKCSFPPQYLEWMARHPFPPMGEQVAPAGGGGGEEKRHILHGGPKPFPGSSALAFALPKLTAGRTWRTWIESPSGGITRSRWKVSGHNPAVG